VEKEGAAAAGGDVVMGGDVKTEEKAQAPHSPRVYGCKRLSGGGCPYTASWLVHVNLYKRTGWILHSTKMETASFNIFDKARHKYADIRCLLCLSSLPSTHTHSSHSSLSRSPPLLQVPAHRRGRLLRAPHVHVRAPAAQARRLRRGAQPEPSSERGGLPGRVLPR
jgi:hypothetical protein